MGYELGSICQGGKVCENLGRRFRAVRGCAAELAGYVPGIRRNKLIGSLEKNILPFKGEWLLPDSQRIRHASNEATNGDKVFYPGFAAVNSPKRVVDMYLITRLQKAI